MTGQDKRAALKRRMVDLGILEDDLIERFIRGTGHGGQKINKTSSCVYLQHQPSGIEIKCQAQRSREMNRFIARRELCERLEELAQAESGAVDQHPALAACVTALDAHPPTEHATNGAHVGVHHGAK